MSSISNQEKQSIISGLEEINCKLQGESIKLDDTKESYPFRGMVRIKKN